MDNSANPQSVMANDVEIKGTVRSSGSVRIDGKLDGELHCAGDAVIGKEAKVKGNLSVSSVSVEGAVNGNITAKDRIELKSTARVAGDIKAKRLTVEDGVTFVGRSEVNPSGQPISLPAEAVPAAVETESNSSNEEEEAATATLKSYGRR